MFEQLKPALLMFLLLTLLTGIAYPLLVTGVAQVAFHNQAEGSLIGRDGKPAQNEADAVGSTLIGQAFTAPGYFWPRPSATAPANNAAASSGSNLGAINPAQLDALKSRAEALRAGAADPSAPIPVDLLTASGSGLDPEISPAGAEYQVHRVAGARGLDEAKVKELVKQHTKGRTLGLLGEARVNVLQLNLALDALAGGTGS